MFYIVGLNKNMTESCVNDAAGYVPVCSVASYHSVVGLKKNTHTDL